MSCHRFLRASRLAVLAVSWALSSTACYTTTLRSGTAAAPATVAYDGKWHHGFVYGIAEVSGPYDLQKVCPNGWSEIETETSFLNGLVQAITYGIYSPQTVTVRCTAGAPSAPAPTGAVAPAAVQPAVPAK